MVTTRLFMVLTLALNAVACISATTNGSARTLDAGKSEWFVTPSLGAPMAVGAEAGARKGFTDHSEIGGKISPVGIGLDYKVSMVRSADPESGVNLAVNPGTGVAYSMVSCASFSCDEGIGPYASLPVLFGVKFGGHELQLAPRVTYSTLLPHGYEQQWSQSLSGGGSLGLAFKMSKAVKVMPEAALMVPFVPEQDSLLGYSGTLGVAIIVGQ
jgi:hypothetical protein